MLHILFRAHQHTNVKKIGFKFVRVQIKEIGIIEGLLYSHKQSKVAA